MEKPNNIISLADTAQATRAEYVEIISKLCSKMNEEHQFSKGDIVYWKRGLSNLGVLKYGEPAVVMRFFNSTTLPVPTPDDDESHSYFRLDMSIGILFSGNFKEYKVDSRRFTSEPE